MTDAILAVVALVGVAYLHWVGQPFLWKANLWAWTFGLLAIAATLGAIAHGFKLSKTTKTILWHPLFLVLGLLVALFMVAAVCDMWGVAIARRVLPVMVVVGAVFFCLTLIWPDNFLVFTISECPITPS